MRYNVFIVFFCHTIRILESCRTSSGINIAMKASSLTQDIKVSQVRLLGGFISWADIHKLSTLLHIYHPRTTVIRGGNHLNKKCPIDCAWIALILHGLSRMWIVPISHRKGMDWTWSAHGLRRFVMYWADVLDRFRIDCSDFIWIKPIVNWRMDLTWSTHGLRRFLYGWRMGCAI